MEKILTSILMLAQHCVPCILLTLKVTACCRYLLFLQWTHTDSFFMSTSDPVNVLSACLPFPDVCTYLRWSVSCSIHLSMYACWLWYDVLLILSLSPVCSHVKEEFAKQIIVVWKLSSNVISACSDDKRWHYYLMLLIPLRPFFPLLTPLSNLLRTLTR
jgi:hypothetical protein